MAEHVQAALDRMVEPLQDLQEREIFSADEIHAIVDRRRTSEYLLRRRQARQSDFIDYIQAEVQLEHLRQLRTKRQQRQQREQNQNATTDATMIGKHAAGDTHVLQHIHALWTRTLRKFRSERSLYVKYADFLKSLLANRGGAGGAHRKLSQLYAVCLQVFPKEAYWWVEAASHEYFSPQNSSIANARVLLQRGLRINALSQDLWLQSFALELHFATKLQGRRQILLQGTAQEEENKEANNDDDDVPDMHRIARLVHDNAVQAITNVKFRMQLLDQCRLFPATQQLQHYILQRLQSDCCSKDNSVEAWIAAARCHMANRQQQSTSGTKGFLLDKPNMASEVRDGEEGDDEEEDDGDDDEEQQPAQKKRRTTTEQSGGDPVLTCMREATRQISTPDMYLQAIRLLLEYMDNPYSDDDDDDNENDDSTAVDQQEVKQQLVAACNALLQKLFQEASAKFKDDADLLLEHVDFLVQQEQLASAIARLERFAETTSTTEAQVWMQWAWLVYEQQQQRQSSTSSKKKKKKNKQSKKVIAILQKALTKIPMENANHMPILLQLLGASMAIMTDHDEIRGIFERILLLAPGCAELADIEEPVFGVKSIVDACVQYLLYRVAAKDLMGVRNVYQAILFRSSPLTAASMSESDVVLYKAFVDASIEAEKQLAGSNSNERRKRLLRLFDAAIEMFKSTSFGAVYQKRREDEALYNYSGSGGCRQASGTTNATPKLSDRQFQIPVLDASSCDFDATKILGLFEKYQIVHLKNFGRSLPSTGGMSWRDVGPLYQQLNDADQASWCIERDDELRVSNESPMAFLKPFASLDRAYCSFLVQKDGSKYEETLSRVPVRDFSRASLFYEKALWIFFGRNPLVGGAGEDLEGRPDHTDSVLHDGTWHYQLSGTKKWFVRPSRLLLDHVTERFAGKVSLHADDRFSVKCRQGDVIILNTRLWFHRTTIPPQALPSVSYARDFRLNPPAASANEDGGMKNVDGLYATDDIEAGTVIFTENDMPDCELHRSSTNPNCEVVELDDGTNAVVSSRDIASGEFFCVPESDDEDNSDGVVSDSDP